ncbi:MAG: glucosaminidase domain-containing protein [Paludibacteraceae bacterium]|nr:glucosaminidase domain-containing protein [Paludibacteraceae bacterium]MBR4840570.1 glucosaminidase domain-containing protein [Paludibacteraceae bacterium]
MKRNYVSFWALLFISQALFAQEKQSQVTIDYINRYKSVAVEEMKKYKIPASITLAQGILESGSGESELAKKSNNHFGIKCHDWQGEKVYHDDDIKNDCFRKYPKPEDSFEDHSVFLQRSRYSKLFDLDITDYEGWAKGLKACGYATSPTYAERLIAVIERYKLYEYDKLDGKKSLSDDSQETNDGEGGVQKNYKKESSVGSISVLSRHEVIKQNGRKAVVAHSGDTYESIAKEFGLRKWEIRWYNKAKKGDTLEEGQTVYIRLW